MMKKRFIICVHTSTNEQVKAFSFVLKGKNVAWWHWLNQTWLISDSKGETDVTYWRDLARMHFQTQVLVFEITENRDTWSGFGNKEMFEWIKENWKK